MTHTVLDKTEILNIIKVLNEAANPENQMVRNIANLLVKEKKMTTRFESGVFSELSKYLTEKELPTFVFDNPTCYAIATIGSNMYKGGNSGFSPKLVAVNIVRSFADSFDDIYDDYLELQK